MEISTSNVTLGKLQEFLEKEKAVALYFSSSRCVVCGALKPKIEDLVDSEFPLMSFLEIKSEISLEISGHYGVFTAPTLLVFFEGKEYLRKVNHMGIGELHEGIERNYKLLFD